MRKYILFVFCLVFLISPVQMEAQTKVDFPGVPRVSAFEAFVKYKAGKAIIVHAGGAKYESRHIVGALNIDQEAIRDGKIKLPKLPDRGIEIFTYCY